MARGANQMSSKLALHCILDGPDEALVTAGMVGCKWVGNAPSIVRPDFISIFRQREAFDVVNDWMPHKTPEQAAEDWVGLQWGAVQGLHPLVYVEGPNEPTCKSPQQAAWLSRFEVRRMQIMLERGHPRCVIYNFSTGTPSLPGHDPDGEAIWGALSPALAHARANGHLLGLHEYGYHWDGWNLGRYRKVYNWLASGNQPGLVITEAGADGEHGPWKDPRYEQAFGNKSQAYLRQLQAYDGEAQKDPYLRAVFIFTKGSGGDAAWEPFNVGGQPEFINGLAQYIASEFDPGSGGDNMAKFTIGQSVWVLASGVKLLDEQGTQGQPPNDAAAPGSQGQVQDGPRTIKNAVRWYVQFNGRAGWAAEAGLTGTRPVAGLQYQGRKIRVQVKPHATPHPITAEVGGGNQVGTMLESSAFELCDEFAWAGKWRMHIISSRFATGWVDYKIGSDPLKASLSVHSDGDIDGQAMDGLALPDFEQAWVGPWPPQEQPPAEPPPVEPPPSIGKPPIFGPPDNLLPNGSFEQGGAGPWPNFPGSGSSAPSLVLERWSQPSDPFQWKQDQPSGVPEILPIQLGVQTPDSYLFYDQGQWCLKVFLDSQPGGAQFAWQVDLPAGTYEFAVPIFPDHWDKNHQRPNVSSDWYLGTQVAAWVGDLPDEQIPWQDGRSAPIGQYTVLKVPFQHLGGVARCRFAMFGCWGLKNNGWVVDGAWLRRTGGTEPPPPDGEMPDLEPELARVESVASMLEAQAGVLREQAALIRGKMSNGQNA